VTFDRGVGLNLRPTHAIDFLREKPKVPFLEVIAENLFNAPEFLKQCIELSETYPFSLHCVGMNIGGTDPIDKNYLKVIYDLSKKLNVFLVSDHLCFQKKNNFYHHDLLPIPLNAETIKNCVPRIDTIQDYLGQMIAIENLSFYTEYKSSTKLEAEVIMDICQKTGCQSILDLNNFEINEKNFSMSFKEQFNYIDLKYIAEIHIAGGEKVNDLFIDTHGSLPSDESITFLNENLNLFSNKPICFERDNNVLDFSTFIKTQTELSQRIWS
jgi:hypothetical protein